MSTAKGRKLLMFGRDPGPSPLVPMLAHGCGSKTAVEGELEAGTHK
jgi:hypothetical protein